MDEEAPLASATCSSAALTLFLSKAAQRLQKSGLVNRYGLPFAQKYGKTGQSKPYLPDPFSGKMWKQFRICLHSPEPEIFLLVSKRRFH